MMSRRASVFSLLWILWLLAFASTLLAGTTGKIAGRVVDKETGAPLPGTNIIIEGTQMGAAADINGQFVILKVPPGTYDVTARMIGYAPVTIRGVRVRIDQTTPVNFELEPQAIQAEAVVVVAEERVVKEDVSTSVASVSQEEVNDLPLSTVSEVVELQAGVQDGLVIRGGSPDEALFMVDGVTFRDPRNDRPLTGIALSAIKEISIERGGFNAEYGQVRSGIVNVVTREGDRDAYSAMLMVRYAPPQPKYDGISPFSPNSVYLRPYLDPAVCWTGTKNGAWDKYTQRQYPTFEGWNYISHKLMTDDDPTNDLSPAAAQRLFLFRHRRKEITDQPDYDIDVGFGGPVPLVSERLGDLRFFLSYRKKREMYVIPLTRPDYVDHDWYLQLTSDIGNSMKLRVSYFTGGSSNVVRNGTEVDVAREAASTSYIRTPWQVVSAMNMSSQIPSRIFGDSYYSIADETHKIFSVKFTHTLSPKTFYEVSLEHLRRKYLAGPKRFRDPTRKYEIIPGYFVDEAPFGFSPNPDVGIGDGMFFGGHTSTSRDSSKLSTTRLRFDLTSQINFNNLLKTGFEIVYSDLDLDYGVVNQVFPESNMYVKMRRFPIQAAAYVQDKIEVKGFIANIGLRIDYHDANTLWYEVNPFEPLFFSSKWKEENNIPRKETKPEITLSPRLGISHPITENSKLFFNYGHFKQLPTYEQLFRIARGATRQVRFYGNPNLRMAKTISYEVGYDHALFGDYLLQLAAYYNDITDQIGFTNYISIDGTVNYVAVNNNSYEDIRGFELTLRKSRGKWLKGFINYTYEVQSSGFFGTDRMYQSTAEQRQWEADTRNRYEFRPIPQPYARLNLIFSVPSDVWKNRLTSSLLGDWKINLLGEWRSGYWGTWNPRNIPGVGANVHFRDWMNLSLRLTKTFRLNNADITLFVDINNVFNYRVLNLESFWDVNDYFDYFNSLHLPESPYYDNIPGKDRPGDYRKPGVKFQPIERIGNVADLSDPDPKVIYYEFTSKRYLEYRDGQWGEVDKDRLNRILKDKAYIDMPNQSSFWFLNPRRVFFGVRVSFNLK